MDCKSHLVDIEFPENYSYDLFYRGAFCQHIIENLVEEASREVELRDGRKISGKIFRVFVEIAQNIRHYSAKKNHNGVGMGLIAIIHEGDKYRIRACNAIDDDAELRLQKKLSMFSDLHKGSYKSISHSQLKDASTLLHGGAGLGLIDIARCCGRPPVWNFVVLPHVGKSFFLEVEIAKSA